MTLLRWLPWAQLILDVLRVFLICRHFSALLLYCSNLILFRLWSVSPWEFVTAVGLTLITVQTLQSPMFLRSRSLVVYIVRLRLQPAMVVLWHSSYSLRVDLIHGCSLCALRTELLKIQRKWPFAFKEILFFLRAELSYQNLAQVCLSGQFLPLLLKQLEAISRVFEGVLSWLAV